MLFLFFKNRKALLNQEKSLQIVLKLYSLIQELQNYDGTDKKGSMTDAQSSSHCIACSHVIKMWACLHSGLPPHHHQFIFVIFFVKEEAGFPGKQSYG